MRRAPRVIPTETHAVAVVHYAGRLLLVRRPEKGRLGGLWEFPGALRLDGEATEAAAVRAVATLADIEVEVGPTLGSVKHAFTHVRVTYEAVAAAPLAAIVVHSSPHLAWVTHDELGRFALPRAQQRIAALILPGFEQERGVS